MNSLKQYAIFSHKLHTILINLIFLLNVRIKGNTLKKETKIIQTTRAINDIYVKINLSDSTRCFNKQFYDRFLQKIPYTENETFKSLDRVCEHPYEWLSGVTKNFSIRNFFHVRCFFNLREFFVYDAYNYHHSINNPSTRASSYTPHHVMNDLHKINFFYYIRGSIDKFRSHTLVYFSLKYLTDRRVNLFFNGMRGMPSLSYAWFFNYNILLFLIKVKLSFSFHHSLSLINNNIIFVNRSSDLHRWSFIVVNDLVQTMVSKFYLINIKNSVYAALSMFVYFKKYTQRAYLRPQKYVKKSEKTLDFLKWLHYKKIFFFKYMESDYKVLSIIFLPCNNQLVYLQYFSLLWLNVWNYRLTTWKYLT